MLEVVVLLEMVDLVEEVVLLDLEEIKLVLELQDKVIMELMELMEGATKEAVVEEPQLLVQYLMEELV